MNLFSLVLIDFDRTEDVGQHTRGRHFRARAGAADHERAIAVAIGRERDQVVGTPNAGARVVPTDGPDNR